MMFMVSFIDGPGLGHGLTLARAPLFLRLVVAPAGERDALDQLNDEAKPDEAIFAYRLKGEYGTLHVDRVDPITKRRVGDWYHTARYALCAEQPDYDVLSDTAKWQAWCVEMNAKEKAT